MIKNKQEAVAKVAELTNAAMKMVREAEEIADKFGIEFSFDVAYGMGGYYMPAPKRENYDSDEDFEDAIEDHRDVWGGQQEKGFWSASSHGC